MQAVKINNKKIVFTINNLGVGGAERLVVDDINELQRRSGVEVYLLTLKKENITTLIKQCNINPTHHTLIEFRSILDVSSYIKMHTYLRNVDPDLIVTNLWFSNTVTRIAALFSGKKNSVLAFEQNVYDTLKTKKMFFADWLLQFCCKKVIAVSPTVAESLFSHGIDQRRLDIIPNSIPIERYQNTTPATDMNDNDFRFVFIGRLIHQKAIDILIQAFAKVGIGKLYIVGQGPDRPCLEDLGRSLGVEKKVTFLGVRGDIPSLLKSADCFVYPSRYDGLSLVLLEAMAAGRPIIVSDFKASAEVIEQKESGIIVPRENVEELSNAMRTVVEDEKLRTHISIGALKAVQKFSITTHIDKILSYIGN